MAVYLGVIERPLDRGGHSVYASLVYINQKGEIKSVHRKLQPTYDERLTWSPGDGNGLKVHSLKQFTVGGLNCWENWMPLPRTALYGLGENLHIAVWPGSDHNTKDITRFIARESRSFVVSVSSLMNITDFPKDTPHINEILKNAPDNLANGGSCIAGPDGEWIIYSSETETGIFALRRVRISDRVDELVLDNGLYNGHARYSADGRYIVFTMGASRQDAGTWEIAQLDTATGIVTLLTDNALRDASPVFSPDGTRILYITFNLDNQTSGIAEMNRDGSDKRILFDSDGVDWAASYSPDGDYIVFTSNVTGQDQLYLMTADGQDVQQITTTGGNYASWIP